jgi:hypothetical protein
MARRCWQWWINAKDTELDRMERRAFWRGYWAYLRTGGDARLSIVNSEAASSRIHSKPQDRIYFDWFIPTKCRTEFPTAQSHQNL